MSEPALQVLEPTNATAAAAEASRWAKNPEAVEDLCFVVEGAALDADGGMIWPPRPVQPGLLSTLWENKDFARHLQPLVKRALQGEEQHYEESFDLPRGGTLWLEINLYPGPAAGSSQALVLLRNITERRRTAANLQLLLESVHLLSMAPDLAAATTSIIQRFCAAAGWPLGEMWIPTPGGALELFASAQATETPKGRRFQASSTGHTLRPQEGLLAELWRGLPVFIPDLAADPEVFRAKAAARAGFHSAFVVPLKSGEQTHALMLFFLEEAPPADGHWIGVARALAMELAAVFQRERMQEQMDSFFNRSLDMHCLAGFDGFLKRVNPAWTRTLGYPAEELLSKPLIEFVHPEDRPQLLEKFAVLGHGEDLTGIEVRCVRKDGTPIWTLWSASPLPSQHLVAATARDINERKRNEASMAQSEEHYRDLFHQAFQMQENLRRMADRLLKIQEHERTRISRDLHDEVGQALTAINMNLAILRNSLVGCAPEIERRISDTQALIENTMGNVHNFSRELRPAMLDDLGLLPALRNYVKMFGERTGIQVQLQLEGEVHIERLDSDRKTVVYRIVQEGLNNVAKHAKATRVDVSLKGSHQGIHLEVTDNGQGFTLDARAESGAVPRQLGLLGLAERARLVGGEFVVASMPARGTVLRATIPFTFQ